MDSKTRHIDIISPSFNEEGCVSLFYNAIEETMRDMDGYTFSIIFVDDGSKDNTLQEIKKLEREKPDTTIKYISFSRNFGKEAAMYAGLKKSTGDLVVLMDCDLQHPPSQLPKMIHAIEEGYDCCAAQRVNRDGEPPVRSWFARLFYKIINKVGTVKIEPGATDFRMMTRQMVDAILQLDERERFSKGLLSWVGFKIKWIEFENVERAAGQTTWSFFSLFSYAVSGIVAFTTAPLRIATLMGTLVMAGSFIYATYMFLAALHSSRTLPGYFSLLILSLFFGGMNMLLFGIVGEYIARIYNEIKRRPIYIIKEETIQDGEEGEQ